MTNPPPPPAQRRARAQQPESRLSRLNPHETPPAADADDELAALRQQLATLRASGTSPRQRAGTLDVVYAQGMATISAQIEALTGSALAIPIQKNTRQRIRGLQQLLRALADDYQAIIDAVPERAGCALWRSLHALAQHLLISSLVAAPAGAGVWRQLHHLYASANRLGLGGYSPNNVEGSVQDVYFSAVLLGCAQPASFTAPEIAFIAAYLARHANEVDLIDDSAARSRAAFWIDPTRDTSAFACSRKSAPPQTPVHYFSCARLARRLAQQLSELENGALATHIKLPDLANTPAGNGVLHRLAAHWGAPSKRRYPRRRQSYRALLCCGLSRLWRLFEEDEPACDEASNWMITNESPDGYALMHVTGKTGGLSVGDITAIRTETGKSWQICIVRWALSENQEHLEIGLQILATRAQPARLALPSDDSNPPLLPVLILPALGLLHRNEMLVIPATALDELPSKLILVVEKKSIEVHEARCLRLEEQNGRIAIFSIATDATPDRP